MNATIYRYRFGPQVKLQDVEETLFLAAVAAEGLHGAAAVRMDACCMVSQERRVCAVDARSDVGRDINLIFTNLLVRQFGREAFEVEALSAPSCQCGPKEAC